MYRIYWVISVVLLDCCLSISYAESLQYFSDQTTSSGISFKHFNGSDGHLYFPEIVSGGGALIDYDQDGDLDVYLVQGGYLSTENPNTLSDKVGGRLYQNNGLDIKTHKIHFTDVTEQSGIKSFYYGMGASVGDVNGDGWPDLYLTNFGHNQLWINDQGRFKDATISSGTDDQRWSVSASFGDIDADGDLDLYVGNYVDYRISGHKTCKRSGGKPDYCSPKSYNPVSDRLFLNNGKGVFEDISIKSGITKEFGGALGVIMADFDGDNKLDIYVANDGVPNQLWMNKGENQFENEALLAGAAVNAQGMSEASMGITAEDHDFDGDIDLFMTHMNGESNTFYENDGNGWFEDKTQSANLAESSLSFTSFGVSWLDFDLDSDLDLFIANGAVILISEQIIQGISFPLNQMNQLLENQGKDKYRDISLEQKTIADSIKVSRGLLLGDLDNDGDLDIIVANDNSEPQLLMNLNPLKNHWLGIDVRDSTGKKTQEGTVVSLQYKKKTITRRSHRDGSYASSNDPRVVFGLEKETKPQTIEVLWIDGTQERWDNLTVDSYHLIRKGTGIKH